MSVPVPVRVHMTHVFHCDNPVFNGVPVQGCLLSVQCIKQHNSHKALGTGYDRAVLLQGFSCCSTPLCQRRHTGWCIKAKLLLLMLFCTRWHKSMACHCQRYTYPVNSVPSLGFLPAYFMSHCSSLRMTRCCCMSIYIHAHMCHHVPFSRTAAR